MEQIKVFFTLTAVVYGTFGILYGIGSMDADWKIKLSREQMCAVAFWGMVQAADIVLLRNSDPYAAQCLLGCLVGCLLTACVMDLCEQAVYQFVWWVAGGVTGLLLLLRFIYTVQAQGQGMRADISGLFLYIFIQHILFGRLYGRADCHAFCVCAAAQTAAGGDFQDYVIHLAISFLSLACLQGFRKNIAHDGNLKKPVPFLPYITVSFLLWVDFMSGKWYI